MATIATTASSESRAQAPSWRQWSHPRQKIMLVLALGAAFATFMPWLETGVGTYRAFAGPGALIFYISLLGLGAGLVPVRWLAFAQTSIFAVGLMFLPVWQIYRMFSLVRFDGWFPGMGMIMIFGSGVVAANLAVAFFVNEQD